MVRDDIFMINFNTSEMGDDYNDNKDNGTMTQKALTAGAAKTRVLISIKAACPDVMVTQISRFR